MPLEQIKHLFFSLLILLLLLLFGAQTTYAKTELVLPTKSISFSIEQTQSFQSLEKEVQPNLGFLKEKSKFGLSEGVSVEMPVIVTTPYRFKLTSHFHVQKERFIKLLYLTKIFIFQDY